MNGTFVQHELKIQPRYFEEVIKGNKTFEIRKNDRNFVIDDVIVLQEYDGDYTGRTYEVKITYITNYAQKDDYVVMSIVPLEEESQCHILN